MRISRLIALLSCLFPLSIFSQNIGAWEIDTSKISLWVQSGNQQYQGIYHFGEGDGSLLILLIDGNEIVGQVRRNEYWTEGGYALESGIISKSDVEISWPYQTLTSVRIINGEFHSDQYAGQFVEYRDSLGVRNGLQIDNLWNKWIGEGRYEIGIRISDVDNGKYFPGNFSQGSTRLLSKNELLSYDLESLRIMRNEIYARYGYRFNTDGDMFQYFNNQEWYRAYYREVESYLTAIELKNIKLILEVESLKREE